MVALFISDLDCTPECSVVCIACYMFLHLEPAQCSYAPNVHHTCRVRISGCHIAASAANQRGMQSTRECIAHLQLLISSMCARYAAVNQPHVQRVQLQRGKQTIDRRLRPLGQCSALRCMRYARQTATCSCGLSTDTPSEGA